MPRSRPAILPALLFLACHSGTSRSANADLNTYLAQYGQEFQRLSQLSNLAEWQSNIHIVEGDSTNSIRTRCANEALARFVGSNENIARIRGYLSDRDRLSPLQARQLDAMLYLAAEKPASAAAVVALDGKAMVEYFEPLYVWLQQQNRGRKATLPDLGA